jgi:hypothetical protein
MPPISSLLYFVLKFCDSQEEAILSRGGLNVENDINKCIKSYLYCIVLYCILLYCMVLYGISNKTNS